MGLIGFLLKRSRGVVIAAMIAGMLAGVCGIGLIALARLGLERSASAVFAWSFAGLCLLSVVARIVTRVAMTRLAQGALARLGPKLAERVLGLPLDRFEKLGPSKVLTVLTEDVGVLAAAFVGLPILCVNLPVVAACFAYIGWLSPTLLAIALVFAVIAIGVYHALGGVAGHRLFKAREAQDQLIGHFRTLVEGFRELKQHEGRRASFLNEQLPEAANLVRDRNVSGLDIYALADAWSQLAFFGFIGLLIFVIPNHMSISREVIPGAVLAVLYILSPLDAVLSWMPVVGKARASLRKIEELMPMLESEAERAPVLDGSPRVLPFCESLELDGVAFSYPRAGDDSSFELGPIDLTLRPGELIFLSGGNGGGKTTLMKLLTGLHMPSAGIIRVDGREIGREESEAYRSLFSVVFADGHLIQSLQGLEPEDRENRAHVLLERLRLPKHVRVDGSGFNTLDLSQGQRKRLALVSALLEDRPIVVLDEWAAHQDPTFKRMFYAELLPELKASGKTLVVVSHDEDYFTPGDRVARLDEGRLTENVFLHGSY